MITFFTQLLLALMFSTNDTDVSLQLCITLPNEVKPQQTVSHRLELTNKESFNSYKQWLQMGSPTQPSEEQLTALLESSNIEQSQVEPFTPCQVGDQWRCIGENAFLTVVVGVEPGWSDSVAGPVVYPEPSYCP